MLSVFQIICDCSVFDDVENKLPLSFVNQLNSIFPLSNGFYLTMFSFQERGTMLSG